MDWFRNKSFGTQFFVLFCAGIASMAYLPTSANAQYFPTMHETKCVPVRNDQRLLKHWDEETTQKIMEEAGCWEFYSFRADATRYRLFTDEPEDVVNNSWDYAAAGVYDTAIEAYGGLTELKIVSQVRTYSATDYLLDGSPIFVGIGRFGILQIGEPIENDWSEVFSFTVTDDQTAIILDRRKAGGLIVVRAYALDLTRNGLLDLALSTSQGVSGSGGVELITLLPNGKFQDFSTKSTTVEGIGNSEYIHAYMESSYHTCSFHDFDADGIWEIETRQYIEYGGGAGSYTFNILHTYNEKTNSWYPCTKRFPEKFERQDLFYEALVYAITQLPVDKGKYMWADYPDDPFVWEYKGRSYNIHYFPYTDVDVLRKLIGNWDDYQQILAR